MYFEKGKWYRYCGDDRSSGWNLGHARRAVLDRRPRKCLVGGDGNSLVKFKRLTRDPKDLFWVWGSSFEECQPPPFHPFVWLWYLHPIFKVKASKEFIRAKRISRYGIWKDTWIPWAAITIASISEYRKAARKKLLQSMSAQLQPLCEKKVWNKLLKRII